MTAPEQVSDHTLGAHPTSCAPILYSFILSNGPDWFAPCHTLWHKPSRCLDVGLSQDAFVTNLMAHSQYPLRAARNT